MDKAFIKETWLFLSLVFLISLSLAISHFFSQIRIFSPEEWLMHQVGMPFAGRSLVADLVRFLADLTSIPYDSRYVKRLFLGIEIFAMMTSSLVVVYTAWRSTKNRGMAYFAYAIFLWQISYMLFLTPVHRYWFSYDFVSLLTMSLGLWLITEERFRLLLLIIAIGSWNRETAIILSAWYFLYNAKRVPFFRLSKRTALLLLTSVTVKSAVVYFHGLSSEIVSIYEGDHLRLLHNLEFWKDYQVLYALGIFGFLWIYLPSAIKKLPNSNSVRCLWSLPPYVAGMLVVGNIHELRIFIEFTPLITLILIQLLSIQQVNSTAQ